MNLREQNNPAAQAYAMIIGKRVTKYAELSTRPCGKCVDLIDIGTIVDTTLDASCEDDREYPCPRCEMRITRSTVAHGDMSGFCGHGTR